MELELKKYNECSADSSSSLSIPKADINFVQHKMQLVQKHAWFLLILPK